MLKQVPDKESMKASWVTLQEAAALDNTPDGLRGDELLVWAQYLENGGAIYPCSIFGQEGVVPPPGSSKSMTIEEMDKVRNAQ